MVSLINKLTNLNSKSLEAKIYASTFKRSIASAIDMMIMLFLRIITLQICANLWFNDQIKQLAIDFEDEFGTSSPKTNDAHISYILNHQIITHSIILLSIILFVGVIYYSYFNSSKWQATPGKRLLSIMAVKNNDSKVNFITSLNHYLYSILPYFYVFYIIFYKISNKISVYNAITNSTVNLLIGLFFIIWVQIQAFTKRKRTIYDMLCNITWQNNKTNNKFPW